MNFILKIVLRYFKKDLTTILKVFDKALADLEAFVEKNTAESEAKIAAAQALVNEANAMVDETNRAQKVREKLAKLVS